MKYRISRKANNDLETIWEYTFNHWSQEQADRYIKIIFSNFKLITKNPDMGKSYSEIRKDYRGLAVKSHIIFYKILKNNEVEIIRILHQRMDLENRIEE